MKKKLVGYIEKWFVEHGLKKYKWETIYKSDPRGGSINLPTHIWLKKQENTVKITITIEIEAKPPKSKDNGTRNE